METAFEHMREIREDAAHFGIRLENGCEQDAVATPEVHNACPTPEVVCTGYRWTHERRHVRHGIIKNSARTRTAAVSRRARQVLPSCVGLAPAASAGSESCDCERPIF